LNIFACGKKEEGEGRGGGREGVGGGKRRVSRGKEVLVYTPT
jgi:hypothetical protein